eukprot:g3213.t1
MPAEADLEQYQEPSKSDRYDRPLGRRNKSKAPRAQALTRKRRKRRKGRKLGLKTWGKKQLPSVVLKVLFGFCCWGTAQALQRVEALYRPEEMRCSDLHAQPCIDLRRCVAPIFMPSRGRAQTAELDLARDRLGREEFLQLLFCEEQEEKAYLKVMRSLKYQEQQSWVVVRLPKAHQGIGYARLCMQLLAQRLSLEFYWQIDDNVKRFYKIASRGEARGKAQPIKWLEPMLNAQNHPDIARVAMAGFASFRRRPQRYPSELVKFNRFVHKFVLTNVKQTAGRGIYYDIADLFCKEDVHFLSRAQHSMKFTRYLWLTHTGRLQGAAGAAVSSPSPSDTQRPHLSGPQRGSSLIESSSTPRPVRKSLAKRQEKRFLRNEKEVEALVFPESVPDVDRLLAACKRIQQRKEQAKEQKDQESESASPRQQVAARIELQTPVEALVFPESVPDVDQLLAACRRIQQRKEQAKKQKAQESESASPRQQVAARIELQTPRGKFRKRAESPACNSLAPQHRHSYAGSEG